MDYKVAALVMGKLRQDCGDDPWRGVSPTPGRQRGIGFSYIHIVRIFLHMQTRRRGVNNVIIEVGGGILNDLC